MCGQGVKIVCLLLLLVAKDGFADVCNDKITLGYGLYMTPELDYKTAVKCCEVYGQKPYDPRQVNERDEEIWKRFNIAGFSEENVWWLPFDDMAEEKRIVNAEGICLTSFENIVMAPGNSEEKDCTVMINIERAFFKWVDCNTKHHLVCRDMEEYENALL